MSELEGRAFTAPQYVVTIKGGGLPAEPLLKAVERVLSGPMHDLVVRLELARDHEGRERLERELGPDPRVRVAPGLRALEEFPASRFHVTLPAGRSLHAPAPAGSPAIGGALQRIPSPARARLRTRLRHVDGMGGSAALARWFASAILRRVSRLLRRFRDAPPGPTFTIPVKALPPPVRGAPASSPRAEYPLGVEIVALGARSQALFDASRRVAWTMAGQHVDLVVADTAAEAAKAPVPAVVLAEAPPLLSVPAFDPRTDNPIGWQREVGTDVGALGPLDRLPPGCAADRVVGRNDRAALREIRHLEDVAAFHGDPVSRAGELVRLAAMGTVVHLTDGDKGGRRLAPYLGAELFELMTREARDLGRDLDVDGRESLSIRMRRAALREHSLTSRARQVAERVLSDPPRLPLVSILAPTRCPELLDRVLETVRRQTYPRLELVLGLHGEGFGEVAADAAGPSVPVTSLRLDASLPLGSVLNALTDAAGGTLLAKMDEDALHGPDHIRDPEHIRDHDDIWDLVLAHEYSQAPLVGKGAELAYLAASGRTVSRIGTGGEPLDTKWIAGGALLITRHMLDRIGGWTRRRRGVDQALIHDVVRAGAGDAGLFAGPSARLEAELAAPVQVDEDGPQSEMAGAATC